mgnify:CR=1 FL=1
MLKHIKKTFLPVMLCLVLCTCTACTSRSKEETETSETETETSKTETETFQDGDRKRGLCLPERITENQTKPHVSGF